MAAACITAYTPTEVDIEARLLKLTVAMWKRQHLRGRRETARAANGSAAAHALWLPTGCEYFFRSFLLDS